MPEDIQFWSYWRKAFCEACKSVNIASFYRGIVGGVVSLLLQVGVGLKPPSDLKLMVTITLGSAALVVISEFVLNLVRAPAKLARQTKQEIDRLKKENTDLAWKADQRTLLEDQVSLQRRIAQRQEERERQESLPQFIWSGGGGSSGDHKYCNFENCGGMVTNLAAAAVTPDIAMRITIAPDKVLHKHHKGTVSFKGQISSSFEFLIMCKTTLGENVTKRFRMDPCRHDPQEIQEPNS